MNCQLCLEPMRVKDRSQGIDAHRECLLRNVLGGIGHLIAHEHWCLVNHDPDAGLTYRQSALLVDAFCSLVGVEVASRRSHAPER